MKQQDLPVQDPERDLRLSHSSASLLLGCEQKYWHYKVNNTPKDADYDDNQTHFAIGKAFHYILEFTLHKHPKEVGVTMTQLLDKCVKDEDILLPQEYRCLVQAMVLTYLREFKETKYEAIATEFSIKSDYVVGFIDALVVDHDTNLWYILDLKTSRTFSTGLTARLPRDRQLNLYAYYADQFAKDFDLDVNNFGGCIYSVTTKSQARQKVKESDVDYVTRLMKVTRSKFFVVPIESMAPQEIYEQHMELYERSLQLREGETPRKNFDYCMQYFQPCAWWSQCRGECFSKMEGL